MKTNEWYGWVNVKWKPGTPSTAWETWKGNSAIQCAWSTVGDWDCTLCLNVTNPTELEKFVWDNVRTSEWVADTKTWWAKQWW